MSQSQRKINSQNYFIFKAHDYFNNAVNTMENVVEHKKSDSFISMIVDALELQDEIYNEKHNKNESKLQSSLNNLLSGITYYCEFNPVLVNHIYIKSDIADLLIKLKEKEKNYLKIYYSLTSLLKKLRSKVDLFINLHIDIIEEYDNVNNFAQIDIILDSFVNELIFHGHSTRYLQEWYRDKIRPRTDNNKEFIGKDLINIFRDISKQNKEYQIIYNYVLSEDLSQEITEYKKLEIKNIYYLMEYEEVRAIFDSGDITKTFPQPKPGTDNNNFFLRVKVNSCDCYKAIDEGRAPLDEYLRAYKLLNLTNNNGVHESCLVQNNDSSSWIKERTTYMKGKKSRSEREKEDIKDLIDLRNNFRTFNKNSQDIKILEKSFDQINKSLDLTEENRLLNVWSSLEYVLSPYNNGSIIGKASDIIPKVISLYYVKGKMNFLWEKLIPLQKDQAVIDLFKDCKEENPKKYNKEAFALFLKNQTEATKLYELLPSLSTRNIVLSRQIAELNDLFNNHESLKKQIIHEHTIVQHDIYRIYRVRNKLVHSGNNIPENINLTTDRLLKYVGYLMGTLIFHMKRNPELTIIEILHSIIDTYDWYLKKEASSMDINEIFSVPYLYL